MISVESRIRELAGQIRHHADLYFNKSTPEISDAEYDVLVAELKGLCEDPTTTSDARLEGQAALAEVGATPTYGMKVKHDVPMGSLDKVNSIDELVKWIKNQKGDKGVDVLATPKMDGLAVSLKYEKGRLIRAATRGNGEVGQDVTDNVRTIESVPQEVKGFTGEVRGEVIMLRSVWKKLGGFANPRNAASGSLIAKDPGLTKGRKLNFVAYDVLGTSCLFDVAKLNWLKTNGFIVVWCSSITQLVFDQDKLSEALKTIADDCESRRPRLDYEIDGIVFSLNSIKEQEQAGWNGRCPQFRIAFKFKPEQNESPCTNIDWQVGRTGTLTPVARVAPVPIAGSTISNVTLHNLARFNELGICCGDRLLIEKAGDIIPQVVRVTERGGGKKFVRPDKCPTCGSLVEDNGVKAWCSNANCPAKAAESILHWLRTLEVDGIGPGIVDALCEADLIHGIVDLYYLKANDVRVAIGGQKSTDNVLTAIFSKNEIPLWQFLDGLGIDGLGTSTSKAVAKKFKTLEAVRCADRNDFADIEGVGDLTAMKIVGGLTSMGPVIDELLKCIDVVEVKESSGSLKGLSFCLTGAMSRGRSLIEKDIEAAGGEVRSGVGKGLSFLVQADPSSKSNKSEKARKLGTKIIGEAELNSMMKVSMS